MLFADAGDFTGDPTVPGRMQTEALLDGMNQIGYQVAAVGQREFNHGYEEFLARRSRARFPFVSGNIVWQDTGETVVDPSVIVKAALRSGAKSKDVRIAFLGLTAANPAFLKQGPGGRKIVTVDPVATASRYVPEMRAKADLVVILSSVDIETARNHLPRKVKDIDFIVGGLAALQTRNDDFPEDSLIGRTRVQYIGDQGKNLGEVRLTFGEKRAVATVLRALVPLTREWPDEPVLAQLMNTTKIAVNDHNRAQAEAQSPFAPAPPKAPAAPAQAATAYTGSERCQPCHEEIHAQWSKTPHAHAFDVLVRDRQDYNPKCVGCHSIGYGRPRGFVDATSTPALRHVGCESCHGPSERHPDPVIGGFGATSTEACRDCHTTENSPDYDPVTYIPKVRHWTDAKAAR